tara:strand:- start:1044 stop:3077 length:2034 start_codon:yes stop_codon:yes gene_type:complete
MENQKKPNALIHETSPYLLQHAYNPVNWRAWNEETLAEAKAQNKPLIISIGYSTCHWCHVMEHESFEDVEVAQFMNKYFVCIKVDREERPDIDHIYMQAVQLMTGHGGWPLNCMATPDGRPFYGGTYFPKQQWISVLQQLIALYKDDLEKVNSYADKLTTGIKQSELLSNPSSDEILSSKLLDKSIQKWKSRFDVVYGGRNEAPKFPIPSNYQFLMHYNHFKHDKAIANQLDLSLQKMAFGGIYDHVGGGFARYSTDEKWKVPHFEKMLYDNAQLIDLYATAFRRDPNPLYQEIVEETIVFAQRELLDDSGAFYAALDADSEGEEGKFYVWKEAELKAILKDDFGLFRNHFNVKEKGFWEKGNYILLRDTENKDLAEKAQIPLAEYEAKVRDWKQLLIEKRNQRIRPSLDDKCITSWNGLMIKGLCEAYLSFQNKAHLALAKKTAEFILNHQKQADHRLLHTFKNGQSSINGYLEDYCFAIEGFIALYQATFEESYLEQAYQWANYCITHFYSEKHNLFYFTSNQDQALISRTFELTDNVIPSSNSSMAKNLFILGKMYPQSTFLNLSKKMLLAVQSKFDEYLPAASNWAQLLLWFTEPFYELALCGRKAKTNQLEWYQNYCPNVLTLGSEIQETKIEILKNRLTEKPIVFYVCQNNSCQLPVSKLAEARKQIAQHS